MELGTTVSDKPTGIFEKEPEDFYQEEIDSPELDTDDFDELPEEEIDFNDEEPTSDPDHDAVAEDETEEQRKARKKNERKKELEGQEEDVRKRVVQMIKPGTIIGIGEMILTRGGSFILGRSSRKDWAFDDEEREILKDLWAAMVKEEEIEFWSAKRWLIITLVVIMLLKGVDVYELHYTELAEAENEPFEKLNKTQKEYKAEIAELEVLELRAKIAKRRAIAEHTIKNAYKEVQEIARNGTLNGNGSPNTSEISKDKLSDPFLNEFPIDEYPPDTYWYIEGELQFTQDGKPRLKPGRKSPSKRHPLTNQFISDEEYYDVCEALGLDPDNPKGDNQTDQEEEDEIEFTETEEV